MSKVCLYCKQIKRLDDFVKSKQYSDGRKDECKECHNAVNRKRYHRNWKQEQKRRYDKHQKLKIAALEAYGGICQCCHESEIAFLTIDHIDNDGARHRRRDGVGGGHNFYQWLKNNNYPSGFQVLCMNCNFSKHTNGGTCVHQEQKNVKD